MMMRFGRRARRLAVAAVPFLTLVLGGRPALAATDPDIVAAFDEVEQAIAELPAGSLGRFQRRSLLGKLERAETDYARGRECRAVGVLEAYLRQTQALRQGERTATAESLYNLGRMLLDLVLAAAPRSRCADPRLGAEPEVRLMESDNRRLAAEVLFGRARLTSIERGDELWTRLWLPGVETRFGEPGLPAVPFFSTLVAVPRGAEVSVRATPAVAESLRLNLYPVQNPPAMGEPTPDDFFDDPPPPEVFADKPFTKNDAAYAAGAPFPADVCTAELVGQFRDLRVARLRCAAARYNPVSDQLDVFGSLHLEVAFSGGDGTFVSQRSRSPFEPFSPAADAVLNNDAVGKFISVDPSILGCLGEELVILTSAALRPAADVLADHRRDHGVPTSVFEVHDGPGPAPDTPAAIRKLVTDRYDTCSIRPSYVLLFGDAEHVPTWYETNPVYPDQVIPSDFPYTIHQQSAWDFGWDFAVGRMPVDAAHAGLVVSNVIAYELTPPADASFYENASIASQFECCQYNPLIFEDVPQPPDGVDQRAFIQVVEDVRDRLRWQGYTVERIYTETIDPGYPLGDVTPRRYADWTLLPYPLRAPFPWSGSTADIVDAWNEGRFLMIHLDHGWPGGWSHPGFAQNTVSNLNNGNLLPVVLSYNCSTGYFDNETDGPPHEPLPADPTPNGYVSFTERLFRNLDGGAIGVISATRTTFATGNIMIRGALDSAIPGLDPAFGPAAPHRRLGDMLNYARTYMWSHSSATGVDLLRHTLLYNLFGDPTLAIWTARPAILSTEFALDLGGDELSVHYAVEGATITALQRTDRGTLPVGRGVVKDGVAVLPYFEQPEPDVPIELFASAENAVSVKLTGRSR